MLRLLTSSLSALGLSLSLAGCTHTVQLASPNAEPHQIVVQGEGEAAAAPDLARVNLGIEILSPNVGEATRQANDRMTAIMTAIKQQGVADKDLRTSQLSVSFERSYPEPPHYPYPMATAGSMGAPPATAAPPPPPAPTTGKGGRAAPASAPTAMTTVAPPQPATPNGFYRVNHTLDVSVRDLTRLGPVVDAAMAAGANSLNGVTFTIEKNEPVLGRAREEAMKDARQRAEALARLGGAALGDLVSIQEEPGGGGYIMPMAKMVSRDAGATPIAAGEVNLQMRVRVVYALRSKGE